MQQTIDIIYPKLPNPQIPFNVSVGISEDQVLQLVSYTNNDPTFKNQTSDLIRTDGSRGRFSTLAEYKKWYQKGKSIYTLLNEFKVLQGISWFSKELPSIVDYQLPENIDINAYKFTFAIRLYSNARGIGLAESFAETSSNHFCQSQMFLNERGKGIWLETDISNIPVIKTYTKLGYRQIGRNEKIGRLIMVKDFLL
jgi:hypothetical protein